MDSNTKNIIESYKTQLDYLSVQNNELLKKVALNKKQYIKEKNEKNILLKLNYDLISKLNLTQEKLIFYKKYITKINNKNKHKNKRIKLKKGINTSSKKIIFLKKANTFNNVKLNNHNLNMYIKNTDIKRKIKIDASGNCSRLKEFLNSEFNDSLIKHKTTNNNLSVNINLLKLKNICKTENVNNVFLKKNKFDLGNQKNTPITTKNKNNISNKQKEPNNKIVSKKSISNVEDTTPFIEELFLCGVVREELERLCENNTPLDDNNFDILPQLLYSYPENNCDFEKIEQIISYSFPFNLYLNEMDFNDSTAQFVTNLIFKDTMQTEEQFYFFVIKNNAKNSSNRIFNYINESQNYYFYNVLITDFLLIVAL